MKQETFMLSFATKTYPFGNLNKDFAKRQFIFNINGQVHGCEPVFSEVIFYMMKGGKLVNCVLSKINGQLMRELDEYKMTGVKAN